MLQAIEILGLIVISFYGAFAWLFSACMILVIISGIFSPKAVFGTIKEYYLKANWVIRICGILLVMAWPIRWLMHYHLIPDIRFNLFVINHINILSVWCLRIVGFGFPVFMILMCLSLTPLFKRIKVTRETGSKIRNILRGAIFLFFIILTIIVFFGIIIDKSEGSFDDEEYNLFFLKEHIGFLTK